MGTRVRATCSSCGTILVPVEQVVIAMSEELMWLTTCPDCGKPVCGETDGERVSALVTAGAQVDYADVVDEAREWLVRATT